ncbi:MAG: Rrf2 family transcriptional regulator [Candidatus Aminicenantaceae bacterium]
MDMIRRNTDYALRLMINLAGNYGKGTVSSRQLAEKEEVSYQLTCKLMQKLNAAGLVKSQMGPKGGFFLSKDPSEINFAAIVEVIQGPITVNSCLLNINACSRQSNCPINEELIKLQRHLENYFNDVTLDKFLKHRKSNTEIKKKK